VKAFRIGGARHPVFDGGGAGKAGGRWNSPGREVIYAGDSFAIAALERLVHASIRRIPADDRYVEIEIADAVSLEVFDAKRHPGWDEGEKGRDATRVFGDRWYQEARSAVLIVPSAVTKIDRNLVINPAHPQFRLIKASVERPVPWDQRLFGRRARPGL
jgi:RES domain-containing protein